MAYHFPNLKEATKAMLAHDTSNIMAWKAEFQISTPVNWWKVSKLVMRPCDTDQWVEL